MVKLSLSFISKILSVFKIKGVSIFISLIAISILFWRYSPDIAFNDVYIFANTSSRIIALCIFWLIAFVIFALRATIKFFSSMKDDKRQQIKEIKKVSNESVNKAKRNFFISVKDAKNTWKNDIKFKKIPLVMIIGNERAGKSAFINYSNIEYPLGDSLDTYKKIHQSTTNFNLYISKNGALIDTEGVHFAQEVLFNPSSTDELPEDDVEKNKDFLLKKNIWKEFLNFLNKNIFHSKLGGAILIVDTQQFLENPKEYSNDLIRYLVKRVNDCENSLKIKFPIYVVFSKLDLVEGMGDYFKLFKDDVANKAFGLSLSNTFNKDDLDNDFKELSRSLLYNIMSKNSLSHSLEDKKRSYLFLKQLDNLFALVSDFALKLKDENSLKNSSPIKGVYFVSAFQENIPINYLVNTVCDRYGIKKPLARALNNYSKQSYFVKSLLKDIVFKGHLANPNLNKSLSTKILNFASIALVCVATYFACSHFINLKSAKELEAQNAMLSISTLLDGQKYKDYTPTQKIELLRNLKDTLKIYPRLFSGDTKFEYPLLDISYKGFEPAKKLYAELTIDFLKNTILVEMENTLETETNPDNLIKAFYMYQSLFDKDFINADLFKIWIKTNWSKFEKYNINQDDFLSHADSVLNTDLKDIPQNLNSIKVANDKLIKVERLERLYSLLEFISYKNEKEFYDIKKEIAGVGNVIENSNAFEPFNKIYTKDGMKQFLSNLSSYIDDSANIEKWLFQDERASNLDTNEDKTNLRLSIANLYLQKYRSRWITVISGIMPKKFSSRKETLDELEILSKVENPVNSLVNTLNTNTLLADETFLKYIYGLGYPSTEIRKLFSNFSSDFSSYHALSDSSKENGILNTISDDVSKIHKKILDFNYEMLQSENDKITYVIGGVKNENDPFIVLNNDSKMLPKELMNYYQQVSKLSWKQVESGASTFLNTAWQDEIYSLYANEIRPFYPFNETAAQSVSIQSFKAFFGKNGAWNQFYDRFLKKILSKGSNGYRVRSAYAKDFKFSKSFLENISVIDNIANTVLDLNDEIKINFYIKAIDLSADFSNISVSSVNDKSITYDHTIPSSLYITPKDFDTSAQIKFIAKFQNGNKIEQKTFSGEWAWHRLLRNSIYNSEQGKYSLYLNPQEKYYFGFDVTPNNTELMELLRNISSFKLPKNILN
ncbi:type VI secretion system membrane subunit TssM [Campylobacter rectus]|uniref:type VI secretion system membrane subunit TssM n=1 Tax=Campylobacter rectus TaxID=203 RepID=UPI0028E28F04|nr:type VI secretion system membrane subunit TssM [Campylobacter rectus]